MERVVIVTLTCKSCGNYLLDTDLFVCPRCGAYLLQSTTEFVYQMMKKGEVERLIETLDHKDSDVRRIAAVALGELGDVKAVNPLIKALRDEDKKDLGGGWSRHNGVQEVMIMALGKLGDLRAVEPILLFLEKNSVFSPSVVLVIKALGKLKDPKAVKPLIKYYEREMSERKPTYTAGETERTIIAALAEIGDTGAVELLIKALMLGEPGEQIIEALAKIGDTRAEEPLNQILESKKKYEEIQRKKAERANLTFREVDEEEYNKIQQKIEAALREIKTKNQ